MATARLFQRPTPTARTLPPEPLAAQECFQAGMRWPKWAAVVSAAGLLALAFGVAMRWSWRNEWEELALWLGFAGLFAIALAWSTAVYGLRVERLGHVLRADARGVELAGLGQPMPWARIGRIESGPGYGTSGLRLRIMQYADATRPAATSEISWIHWLTGRAAGCEVIRGVVYSRLTYADVTLAEAAARLNAVGRHHGWRSQEDRHDGRR